MEKSELSMRKETKQIEFIGWVLEYLNQDLLLILSSAFSTSSGAGLVIVFFLLNIFTLDNMLRGFLLRILRHYGIGTLH